MIQQLPIEVSAFIQNCRLIWDRDSRNAFVLDPGGDPDKIIQKVEELGLKIVKVLLTHGHLDHIAYADKLRQHYDVQILGCHRADKFFFLSLPDQMRRYGLYPIVEAFEPDCWMNEGDTLELNDNKLEVLHCPGHSPGHLVFVDHVGKQVFVGDVLFNSSIGRTDLPMGDFEVLKDSILSKLYTLGDDYLVLPGHGPDTTIAREKKSNPFVRIGNP